MSDLMERFASEVRRRPLLTLAITGAVGAVVVSRLRADDDRPGGRVADLAGRGVASVGRQIERSAEMTDRVARGVEDAGHRTGDAIDDFSLRDLVRRLADERFGPSRVERVRRAAASVGITEKTVAVFAATLLAKSSSGYLRWRGEKRSAAALRR